MLKARWRIYSTLTHPDCRSPPPFLHLRAKSSFLFKALGTWKMKLCTGFPEPNHGSVVQKHTFAKKTLSRKRVALRLPGGCFSRSFWSFLGDKYWKMTVFRTLFFVCFLGTEKGSASHATSQRRGGVGPFNWLNWIELLITELLNYWFIELMNDFGMTEDWIA